MRPSDQDVYDLLERVMALCLKIENEHETQRALSAQEDESVITGALKAGLVIALNSLVDDAISIRVDASDMSRDIAGHSSM